MAETKERSLSEAVFLHCQGKGSKEYLKVVKLLTSGALDGEKLSVFLRELKEEIVLVDKQRCNVLITAILNLNWLNYDYSVIKEYKSFLLHFVSAHTNYLKTVLRSLVKTFFTPENSDTSSYDTSFHHVHEIIQGIIKIVPMTASSLLPILSDCFPYILRDVKLQTAYIRNLLYVCTYLPTKRYEILEMITSQIIHLDVYIPKQKILETDSISDASEMFEMELDVQKQKDQAVTRQLINTLDVLMEQMFTYIKDTCFVDEILQWEATKKLYHDILLAFNSKVLNTHASGHVQFFIFYMCGLKPILCENTLEFLWKKFDNPNTSSILRQISSSYLSNFIAHATYVDIKVVIVCLDNLSSWIHQYIDGQSGSCEIDFSRHSVFYSACQSLFYIFVFRHRELIEMKNGFSYLRSLNFERIVTCQLNPLRVCHPNIVSKFALISRNCQLVYCYTVMEKNERYTLPTDKLRCVEHDVLDAFFPFDSYLLEKSKRFILPIHLENETNAVEAITAETEEDDFLTEIESPSSSDFPMDILNNSFSPRFKTLQLST